MTERDKPTPIKVTSANLRCITKLGGCNIIEECGLSGELIGQAFEGGQASISELLKPGPFWAVELWKTYAQNIKNLSQGCSVQEELIQQVESINGSKLESGNLY